MKKYLAILIILLGACFVIYSLLILVSCFALLTSKKFNSESMGYSFGTLLSPLLLIAFARWIIRKGIKIYKSNAN